ncbi:uncharacterized protein DUF4367 [Streptohalobacillus salinus]|uniref:Uncharacterized protein DUF4367 n=1 Tax=Streptohalobacillus salinus TaxID=621096 RepID=A0A2V3VWR0_9BACI|nr:DUF4367 domain-containing protein [Streptohalobacillus salinus]PXW86020.1 uncharacterized protein DUF4367 [Streptohalobacillus salinus]
MIIGAFVFGNINETKAFNPFYQSLKEIPGDITSLFFGNKNEESEAKTDPPSNGIADKEMELTDKVVSVNSLEEVQNRSAFQIPSFKYIPVGYKFKNADLFMLDGDNTFRKVRLTFSNKEKSFWVSLNPLESDTTVGSGSKKSNIKEIQLKNGKGYLTISDDGNSKLEFLRGNVYVSVLGDLPQEELIRFANNM